MDDRELLELAARAHGAVKTQGGMLYVDSPHQKGWLQAWSPLTDDGDALRLAVRLNLSIRFDSHSDGTEVNVYGEWDDAPEGAQETFERRDAKATRRAIVRAAAAIGQQQP